MTHNSERPLRFTKSCQRRCIQTLRCRHAKNRNICSHIAITTCWLCNGFIMWRRPQRAQRFGNVSQRVHNEVGAFSEFCAPLPHTFYDKVVVMFWNPGRKKIWARKPEATVDDGDPHRNRERHGVGIHLKQTRQSRVSLARCVNRISYFEKKFPTFPRLVLSTMIQPPASAAELATCRFNRDFENAHVPTWPSVDLK